MRFPTPVNLMSRLTSQLRRELHPRQLLPNLAAGLLCGVIEVTFAISLASLIFAGTLPGQISTGIGLGLITVTIVSAVTALTSSYPGTIAIPQEVPAVIIALMVSTIVKQMPADISSQDMLITITAAIAFTTALTGLSFFLLGFFKLGNLIRFIPYPVVGGFLASTGWLLVTGAISLLIDRPIQLGQLATLFSSTLLIQWLPGFVFAILLLLILRRYTHFLIVPGMLLAAISLFYITLLVSGTSIVQATEQRFLLQPFSQQESWRWLNLSMLFEANWTLIFQQLNQQITLVLLSVLALLINASGIELLIGRSIDFNRELRAAGIANFLSGLTGGIVGFHSISSSALSYRVGTGSATAGMILSIFCAVALFLGASVIALVPKFILGGVLLFLGLELLIEWLFDGWFKLPKTEYSLVLLILVVNTVLGLLKGIAIGLIVAVVLFVLKYSRTQVTRYVLSGENYHSHTARTPSQMRLFSEEGKHIHILDLQGFLFFGTANTLFEQIYQRIQAVNLPLIKYVVLNFRLVTGLDSSAVLSFIKLKQFAQQQQLNLVFTQLSLTIQQQLQQGGCLQPNDPVCRIFPDLDRGMEWCENQILETISWRRKRTLPLVLQLDSWLPHAGSLADVMDYLEEMDVDMGDILFHQGAAANALYLIESGQITVWANHNQQNPRRMQTLGTGNFIGEMEFFSETPYRTSAIVDSSSTIYFLSLDAFTRMQQEAPQTAIAFQKAVNYLLAERLSYAYREIEQLLY
jgi:sulfate permease, SulP family